MCGGNGLWTPEEYQEYIDGEIRREQEREELRRRVRRQHLIDLLVQRDCILQYRSAPVKVVDDKEYDPCWCGDEDEDEDEEEGTAEGEEIQPEETPIPAQIPGGDQGEREEPIEAPDWPRRVEAPVPGEVAFGLWEAGNG